MRALRIIKFGGSLLDWEQSAAAYAIWSRTQPPKVNLLIAGGGRPVNALRELSDLDDEQAHWKAIRMMERNARHLSQRLALPLAVHLPPLPNQAAVLGAIEDHVRRSHLPTSWDVSSDSIAAWFAKKLDASELVLLKSRSVAKIDANQLSRSGVVDRHFPQVSAGLNWRVANLRRLEDVLPNPA